MPIILLATGQECLVDTIDYDYLSQWNWYFEEAAYLSYVVRSAFVSKQPGLPQRKKARLHRIVALRMGLDIETYFVDHIDGNTLDNRRKNIRVATAQQSAWNRALGKNNTSGKLGVAWNSRQGCWVAYISANGKRKHLGTFQDYDKAAEARIAAEEKYYGEFRRADKQKRSG